MPENRQPAPRPVSAGPCGNCSTAVDQGPVLDPFIGSGTTAVVAEERGLYWVVIDVSASYLDMAATRIAAAQRSYPNSKTPRLGWRGFDV